VSVRFDEDSCNQWNDEEEGTSVDDDLFDTSNAIVAAKDTPSGGEGTTSRQEDMMESTSRMKRLRQISLLSA
jgi:hypothetical protein